MCMIYLAKGFHLELKGIMRIITLIVLKCPSVDSLHQNHFGSTLNMYILSFDFQVAMLGLPMGFSGVCPVNKSPKKFCWVGQKPPMQNEFPCKMSFLAVFILKRKQKTLEQEMTYSKLPKLMAVSWKPNSPGPQTNSVADTCHTPILLPRWFGLKIKSVKPTPNFINLVAASKEDCWTKESWIVNKAEGSDNDSTALENGMWKINKFL